MEKAEFLYLIFWTAFLGDGFTFTLERKELEIRDGKN